jgi:hypothetical protein
MLSMALVCVVLLLLACSLHLSAGLEDFDEESDSVGFDRSLGADEKGGRLLF